MRINYFDIPNLSSRDRNLDQQSAVDAEARDLLEQLARSSYQGSASNALRPGIDPMSQRLPSPMVLGMLLGAVSRLSQLNPGVFNNPDGSGQLTLPPLMNRLPAMASYANDALANAVNVPSNGTLAPDGSYIPTPDEEAMLNTITDPDERANMEIQLKMAAMANAVSGPGNGTLATSGSFVPTADQQETLNSITDPFERSLALAQMRAMAPAANGSGAPWMNLLPPGWTPDQPITLDPSRAFDVNYMRQVMAQTAVVSSIQQGKPLPSQSDMENAYQYWIPKMQTIGGNGLDSYWLSRLLQPPDSGGGSSASYASTASPGYGSTSSNFGGASPAVADAAAAGAFSDAPSADEQQMLNSISDPSERARMQLQLKLQKQAEIASMISNILNIKHQTAMSIIGNIR